MFKIRTENVELTEEITRLKRQVVELEIQESKIKELHAKEDRELRHMIGLEKKRQEVELEQTKKGAVLEVREENLKAEKDRFTDEMKFMRSQFDGEMKRMESIYKDIMARMPTVTVDRVIKEERS